MAQKHLAQTGTFHVTTNAHGGIPWCTWPGVPEALMDNLVMTRNLHGAKVFAFCILPNHMHILVEPGEKGLSRFVQSFKSQSMLDIKKIITNAAESRGSPLPEVIDGTDIRWQKSFHDRQMRTNVQRNATLAYVSYNAWRHGMTPDMNDWPWSSVHYPHLLDPMEIWFS